MKLTKLYTHPAAQFMGRLLLAGTQILVLTIVAWYILRLYPGDAWTPVRLVTYFLPWFFMALLPGLLIAWLAQQKRLMWLIIGLLVVFLATYRSILIPHQAPSYADYAESSQNELRVMTFNINFQNNNVQGIADLIKKESPDIIAFQEMTDPMSTLLRPHLEAMYPYYEVDKSWPLHMALMSRYPLTTEAKPDEAVRAQHASVETPKGVVNVWNVHPNPAITTAWEQQRALLAVVANELAQDNRPTILMGDFNATEQAQNYELIAEHLTDVHWVVGQGFSFTYPDFSRANTPDRPWYFRLLFSIGPVIKIDHIFVDQHFIPKEVQVLSDSQGSDHRPILATLSWKQ